MKAALIIAIAGAILAIPGTITFAFTYFRWRAEGRPGARRFFILGAWYAAMMGRNACILLAILALYHLLLEPWGWRVSKSSLELVCKVVYFYLLYRLGATTRLTPRREPQAPRAEITPQPALPAVCIERLVRHVRPHIQARARIVRRRSRLASAETVPLDAMGAITVPIH